MTAVGDVIGLRIWLEPTVSQQHPRSGGTLNGEKPRDLIQLFRGNGEVGEMILSKNMYFWGQLRLLNEKGTNSDLIKSSTEFNFTWPHPKRVALEGEISLFQWNWAWWIIIICPGLISSVVQTTTLGSSRFHGKKCISWYTRQQSCLGNPPWK